MYNKHASVYARATISFTQCIEIPDDIPESKIENYVKNQLNNMSISDIDEDSIELLGVVDTPEINILDNEDIE